MQTLDSIFKNNLPDTLYLSHYELSNEYGSTPNEWRQYLKENEHFITSETAAIAEANSRAALSKLGQGASTQEVSAIKALLEKSKLINDAQKQQQHVLLTFVPPKGQIEEHSLPLKEQVEFLREYIEYLRFLHDTGRLRTDFHTEKWYKNYKAEREQMTL